MTWVGELMFASSPGHTHVVMMIGVKECRANRFGLLQTTDVLVECSRQVAFKPLFRKSPVAASDEMCVCPGLDIRYDTRCYFNVRSKADISQLNLPHGRESRCLREFRAYCICLYSVALWSHITSCIMMKFKYCHNKCMKKFLGYSKYYSVTEMLLALGLSSFDTVIHNYRKSFLYIRSKHSNDLVKLLRCVSPSAFL